MKWLFQPLLMLIAASAEGELAKQIEYLKAENQMLRKRIDKRIFLGEEEKRLLVKLGQAVGRGVSALLTVVSYPTYRRWVGLYDPAGKGVTPAAAKGKGGRPRTSDDIRLLVLKLARENDWGYTRILGELKKLGITRICRTTVVNILRENQMDPKTDPDRGTWGEFLKAHAQSLWQCDFFSKHIITPEGVRQCFILGFLHVATRRVFVSPCTFKPDAAWMIQQGEAFLAHANAQGLAADYVLRDRDCKFAAAGGGGFDVALAKGGVIAKPISFRSPNLNAYIERFVQTIGQECLDKLIVFGTEHFDHVVSEYVEHYLHERPHQSLGNAPLVAPAAPVESRAHGEVRCRERLGGLLRHYYRAA